MKIRICTEGLRTAVLLALLLAGIAQRLTVQAQGSLAPAGPPGPTFKTLTQVEPRTPISALPYTISAPGSYYLSTNLTGGGGITIQASGVTLDLMGFELAGGTGSGIIVFGARSNLWIGNGTIRAWPVGGVAAQSATHSRFQALRLVGNTGPGLQCGYGATVVDCQALSNSSVGIMAAESSVVADCGAYANGTDGIATSNGARVSRCIANSNLDDGVEVGQNCTVTECTANYNTDDGIVVDVSTTVTRSAADSNQGDGIQAYHNAVITENRCSGNGYAGPIGAGIHLTGIAARVDNNHAHHNDRAVSSDLGGNLIIRNSVSGNSTPHFGFSGGDRYGATNYIPAGLITNNSPWINFSL